MLGTTNVVVELVIVGCQALVWAVILIAATLGIAPTIAFIGKLSLGPFSTVMSVALLYTLGIFIDRLSSIVSVFTKPGSRLLKHPMYLRIADAAYPDVHVQVAAREETLDAFLNSYRVRFRVVNGMALNSMGFVAAWLVLAVARTKELVSYIGAPAIVLLGIVGVLVAAFSILAAGVVQAGYQRRLAQIARLLNIDIADKPTV
jgi:hypothetical protein